MSKKGQPEEVFFQGEPPQEFKDFATLLRASHDMDSKYDATADLVKFFQKAPPLYDPSAAEGDRMFDISIKDTSGKPVYRNRYVNADYTKEIIQKLLNR